MRRTRKALVAAAAVAVVAAAAAGTTSASAAVGRPTPIHRPASAFQPGSGQLVVDWNRELITIQGTPGEQPATVHSTRSFAILQAAEYDAVVSITHRGQPYLFSVLAARDANPEAAADQAAHDVLTALYPSVKGSLDTMLATELAAIRDGRAKTAGERVGAKVAERLIGIRSTDGSAATPPPFTAGDQPGDYRPTPPNFPAPVFTNWGSITPFVLHNGAQFRPGPPPPITSAAYAAALNEVKSLGQNTSTTRTADQTAAAKFWGSAPIWNTWNQVAQNLAVSRHASLEQTATVFANLDLALADATIALYDAKYHYLIWRPVTAIELGNTIGNPGIVGDPTWLPLAVTAPDPSFPGAHSTISQAAASVLTAFYGHRQPLAITLNGITRSFGSFQAAANEAGLSRIFAGQHTRLDHEAGQRLGVQVAESVLDRVASDLASAG
ncbi:MAG TPA: vanadium-dependent haloperoxidase [Streptosporangiaceae bacterium]|jgi:membrane-associated phospholipid phosphatase|nr:vanadium-dependent haloperoxidase [Streptosporangiaceae bacterium]